MQELLDLRLEPPSWHGRRAAAAGHLQLQHLRDLRLTKRTHAFELVCPAKATHGCGCQNRFGIPVWLVDEFTTHFRTYFSGD